jgi:hypothetical protein
MPRLKARFRGLNTDLPMGKLPSGCAREALNVLVTGARIRKRLGFSAYAASASGTVKIVGMWIVPFKAKTYLVIKITGPYFYCREVYPTPGGWSSITVHASGHTHSGTDRGWAFVWNDRWVYSDSGGTSQWNPLYNSGQMVKAGLPKPASGSTLAAAACSTWRAWSASRRLAGPWRPESVPPAGA